MPEVELKFLKNGLIDTAIIRKVKINNKKLPFFIYKIKKLTNRYNVLFNKNTRK